MARREGVRVNVDGEQSVARVKLVSADRGV